MYNIGIDKRRDIKKFFDLLPLAAGKSLLRFVEEVFQARHLFIRDVIYSIQAKAYSINRRVKANGTTVFFIRLKF